MLKKRILTACVLIPVLVLLLLKGAAWVVQAVSLGFVLLAAWEWSAFVPLSRRIEKILYLLPLIGLIAIGQDLIGVDLILLLLVCFWCFSFLLLYFYPSPAFLWQSRIFKMLLGFGILWGFWVAFMALYAQPQGSEKILFLLSLVWGADTGAYFMGRAFGRRRLAPLISPGKTRMGALGAFLAVGLLSIPGVLFFQGAFLWIVCLACLIAFFAILGDLLESALKRSSGLKDSGSFFPGHGGVLDRLDSLLATFPVFAFLTLS